MGSFLSWYTGGGPWRESAAVIGVGLACLCVAAVLWLWQRRKKPTAPKRTQGFDTADLDGQ
jgi:hypothetical protein